MENSKGAVSAPKSGESSATEPDSEIDSLRKIEISATTSGSHVDGYFSKSDAVLERAVPMSFGQSRF